MDSMRTEEEPRRSKAMTWFVGCLGALVIFAALCAGGSWLMCSSIVDWAVEAMHGVFVEAVEQSDLDEEDIASIKTDLDRLRDAFLEDRVQQEELQDFERDFERVLGIGFAKFMVTTVLPDSGMEGEELAGAERTAQRFGRGIQEGSINSERGLGEFQLENEDGEWNLDDVRDTVSKMKAAADRANVPDEPLELDVAGEFTQLVDSLIDG